MSYINYHVHSIYSVLDGIIKIDDYIAWAKAHKLNAIGITDHGQVSGLIQLWKKCNSADIKPLLGFEAYYTDDEKGVKESKEMYHLILIAKNRQGWDNIIKLHNEAYDEDMYYYKCRINIDMLKKYHEGIICTTACIGSKPAQLFINGDKEGAINHILELKSIFNNDLYLEMQEHGIPEEKEYNKFLYQVSQEHNIKYVIQNDAHYTNKEDAFAHEVLLCKNTRAKITDENRFKFPTNEFYLKDKEDIFDTFDYFPNSVVEKAIENIQVLADSVENFDITYKQYNYPTFGNIEDSFKKLKQLTIEGFNRRFKDQDINKEEYIERLKTELSAIKKIGFVDYFLILEDLIKWANSQDIWTGYGRGSAGGSLVMYCLGITGIDPIKYGLLFSRFIDEHRISAPDVDSDFDDNDRDKVIEYLTNKYGDNRVGYISTFGELKAKNAFKAVASILDLDFKIANNISSKMDSELSLKENFQQEDLKPLLEDPKIKKIYDIALVLEGGIANTGLHACGQIISNKPFNEILPCITSNNGGKHRVKASSFEMKEIDGDLKLLKLDILGLRNLGVLKEATHLIKQRHNIDLDFKSFDFKDGKTYAELSKGNSCGVFQFESQLMQRLLKSVKPRCLEDLSIVTSIGRPASLQSGLTDSYLKRRSGEEPVEYLLPELEPLMKDTLGIYGIYQESLMQVCKYYAGMTDSEADQARKICGKKLKDKLPMLEKMFKEGSSKMGRDQNLTDEVFENLKEFASYGFNKSHAIAYSALSYATAYYKANYPIEFMTALLNSVSSDIDKIGIYINECMRLGIDVLPPDINESIDKFSIDKSGKIRFGFNAIKSLGDSAITNIIKSRKDGYKSVEDFIRRATKVNKSGIQALLRVGAFNQLTKTSKKWDIISEYIADIKKDGEYPEDIELSVYRRIAEKEYKTDIRYKMLKEQKKKLKTSKKDQEEKSRINKKLEDIKTEYFNKACKEIALCDNYLNEEIRVNELELLGFSITTHPYKRWYKFEKYFTTNNIKNKLEYIGLDDALERASLLSDANMYFHTVGLISNIKTIKTKKTKEEMAILTIEYFNTKISCTLFPKEWSILKDNVNICDMFSIVAKIEEAYNYGVTQNVEKYTLKAISFRKLNVLNNIDNKLILKADNNMDEIVDAIKKVSYKDREAWKPINKAVFLQKDNKFIPVSGLAWINNSQDVLSRLG